VTAMPPPSAVEVARTWLATHLPPDGRPVLLHDVLRAAKAVGIALPALRAAAKTLRVQTTSVRAIAWSANREEKQP
jgi:hypothetical protein